MTPKSSAGCLQGNQNSQCCRINKDTNALLDCFPSNLWFAHPKGCGEIIWRRIQRFCDEKSISSHSHSTQSSSFLYSLACAIEHTCQIPDMSCVWMTLVKEYVYTAHHLIVCWVTTQLNLLLLCTLVKINLYQNVFKIHAFHTKYTTKLLTYLLPYCLRLTDKYYN